MSIPNFNIIRHSPDRQRVVVEVVRNGVAGKYLVTRGTKTFVWVRTKGRSYVISADKCNCPASRGRCKHVLVTSELTKLGFFPTEQWVRYVPPTERDGIAIRRHSKDARNLFREEHWGQGWHAGSGCTVAVLRNGLPVPQGWCVSTVPDEVEFARKCFVSERWASAKKEAV